jgi:TPR repeat protein
MTHFYRHNLLIANILFIAFSAFAHTGLKHQSEIVESIFGSQYLSDDAAKELVDYISQGMDFGNISRETILTKPGSSFLNAVRKKYPDFKGTHREFGHWAFDGDIPREVIDNFENYYPGKGEDFKSLWRQFVRTRREATRLGLGLTEEGSRAAQSISSLAGSCHDLGDWTTVQTDGLPPIKNVIRYMERSYHRLLGNNNKVVSEFIDDIKAVPTSIPQQKRAVIILQKWKTNSRLHEATESVLKQRGFKGKFCPIKYKAIAEYDKFASKAIARSVAKPKIQLGKTIVKPVSRTGKVATKTAGRVAVKAGGRSVFAYLGWVAPIAVDVGFWLWEDYKIRDEYTKGRIHESERREKRVVNTGRAVGGVAGAWAGGATGDYINKKYGPGSDGSGGGLAGAAIVVATAIIGGIIGEWVGGGSTKTVYEWVARPPYIVCSEACEIGDIDAMFFKGVYLYEGRNVEQNKGAAAWWFECAAREGDVRAQFYLGEYWQKAAEPNNPTMAFFWWSLAANSSALDNKFKECIAAASLNLANCFFNGEGVAENEFLGIYYLNRAKEFGNKDATASLDTLLANCRAEAEKTEPDSNALKLLGNYYSLFNDEENQKRAFNYMLRAAQLGNLNAINNVGNSYRNGKGVEKDLARAIGLYKVASEKGNTIAIGNLANVYKQMDMWDDDTIGWLIEQSNAGHAQSCILLADIALQATNDDLIKSLPQFANLSQDELCSMHMRLLERAEDMGSSEAKILLAKLAENKQTASLLSDNSAKKYEQRLLDASFQNYPVAQLMLAKALKTGYNLPKDEKKAALFFALAALNGIPEAQSEYGNCCYFGTGTPKNLAKAARWFQLSANQGWPYGEYCIGWCYAHGEGVSQDKTQARYWLKKAVDDGYKEAKKTLAEL